MAKTLGSMKLVIFSRTLTRGEGQEKDKARVLRDVNVYHLLRLFSFKIQIGAINASDIIFLKGRGEG